MWADTGERPNGSRAVVAELAVLACVCLLGLAVGSVAVAGSGAVADCPTDDADHFMEGCLDAGASDAAGWSESAVYDVPAPEGEVVVTLQGPADADFDLYVSLDGRRPSPKDFDRKSEGEGSEERVSIDASKLSGEGRIGITVHAYRGSGAFTVDVKRVSATAASLSGPESVRPDEVATFDARNSTVANGSPTYVWRVDGSVVKRGGEGVLRHEFAENGTHEVGLTVRGDDSEDATSRTVSVAGDPVPAVAARLDVLSGDPAWINESIRFTADRSVVTEGPVAEYRWSFGDGTTATGETVAHAFSEPGTYEVTLTARTETGATSTATTTVEVRRPKLRIREVEGSTVSFVPGYLFPDCTDPMRVEVQGTDEVRRVAFELGEKTVVDRDGSDGWTVNRTDLPTGHLPSDREPTLEVTAYAVTGRTDTETVRIETAPSPEGIRAISDLLNKYSHDRGVADKWAPISVEKCRYTIYYPQITSNVSAIPELPGSESWDIPAKLGRFMPAGENILVVGQFRLTYHPDARQVSLGGGGRARIYLNPQGETRIEGKAMLDGYFTLPDWKLQRQKITGDISTRVYLEEYVSPVPIPQFRIVVDNPTGVGREHVVNETIDPIDVWIEPKIKFEGSINSEFELSSLTLRGRGQMVLHGQLGDKCHFNAAGFGCFGMRKWVEGRLQSDYMGLLPFDPQLGGQAVVESGYQLRSPSNLVPDRLEKWSLSWDLPTAAARVTPAGATAAPGDRAYAGTDRTPSLTVDLKSEEGHGPKRTSSPGRTLTDEDDTNAAALRSLRPV